MSVGAEPPRLAAVEGAQHSAAGFAPARPRDGSFDALPRAVEKAIEGLVRLGYLAKALVYILVGALALKVATGAGGGRLTDPGGALYVVLGQPFGRGVLLLVPRSSSSTRCRRGPPLLTAAAAGVLAYGIYQLPHARYATVEPCRI